MCSLLYCLGFVEILLRVLTVVLLSPRSTPMATSLWVSRTTDACQQTL